MKLELIKKALVALELLIRLIFSYREVKKDFKS